MDIEESPSLPCCGKEPILRVKPRMCHDMLIAYVTVECPVCKTNCGLWILEDEARQAWWQMYQP